MILNNFETLFSKSYSSVELFFIKIQPNKDVCAQGLFLLRTREKNQYAKSKTSMSVCKDRKYRGEVEREKNQTSSKTKWYLLHREVVMVISRTVPGVGKW